MAEHFLYLTTTGRTSGQPRRIEIWFVAHAGRYYLVSELRDNAHWVKNLQALPRVVFSIGTREDQAARLALTPATVRVVSHDDEPELVREISALMDAKYGWSDGLIVELTPHPAAPSVTSS